MRPGAAHSADALRRNRRSTGPIRAAHGPANPSGPSFPRSDSSRLARTSAFDSGKWLMTVSYGPSARTLTNPAASSSARYRSSG